MGYNQYMISIEVNEIGKVASVNKRTKEVCMVLKKDEKYLLVTKAEYPNPKKMFRLPTGGFENNESSTDTLKRELLEEFNLQLKGYSYLGCLELRIISPTSAKDFCSYVYLVKVPENFDPNINTEHSACIWASIEDIPNYIKNLKNLGHKYDNSINDWEGFGRFRAETLDFVLKHLKN